MEEGLENVNFDAFENDIDESEEIFLSSTAEISHNILENAKNEVNTFVDHGNLTYVASCWLHEGKYARKIAQAVIVQRHIDDSYKGIYLSIEFWKRPKLTEPFQRKKKIQFSMEETQKLLKYMREATMTSEADDKTYVLLPAVDIIDNLGETERQTFVNILSNLVRSRRVAELFASGQFNDDTINHLAAAAQQVRYKSAIDELNEMIEGIKRKEKKGGKIQPLDEHSYQEWFESHTWVFGTEYVRRINLRDIDAHSSVDFILETSDGFFDVLELKTPGVEVLVRDKSHNTWYFSAEVAKVIAQAAKYLNAIEQNANNIYRDSRSQINLIRPRVRIVIGRSKHWDDDQRDAFRRLGAMLHSVDLMTFDHVVQRAQQLIAYYESQSELS